MAKSAHNDVADAYLNVIATATKMVICSSEPTTYAEATSTYALADVVIDSSDFTIADGDSNGRKVTIAEQANVTIDANGTAGHIALVITDSSKLLFVTTCTAMVLAAAGVVTIPAWKITVSDPT